MQPQPHRHIGVTASVSDPFDGIVRLLLDAARFGFGLDQVAMTAGPDATWAIRMTLEIEPSVDCQIVAHRLSRHPTITNLRAVELSHDEFDFLGVAHPSIHANQWMRP